jgi:hypothetical protein
VIPIRPALVGGLVLADAIAPGSTRFCQTYYRDGNPTYCPSPQGSSFNVSNGEVRVW